MSAFSYPTPFVLALAGTSLTQGRLATPPTSWALRLLTEMRASEECKGVVRVVNSGVGSSTSGTSAAPAGGITQARIFSPQRPTHLLMEDFGINDCVPSSAISLVQQTANLNTIRDLYVAANPDVVIVHQTMSSASAADVNRTTLADYYANGTTWAASHGLLTLDNYADWPKPLNPADTVDGDGLHPLWDNVFQTYSYPNILTWARDAMAAFWP